MSFHNQYFCIEVTIESSQTVSSLWTRNGACGLAVPVASPHCQVITSAATLTRCDLSQVNSIGETHFYFDINFISLCAFVLF